MSERISTGMSVVMALSFFVVGCGSTDSDSTEVGAAQRDSNAKELWERAERYRSSPGKADRPGCSGVVVPDQQGLDKRIALTFDDGPHPTNTRDVLDVLAEHDAKAAFFALGRNIRRYPETYKEIVEAGHIVGNHSYAHPNFRGLTQNEAQDEFDETHSVMTEHGPTPKFMRFPYGAATCEMVDLAESYGYRVTGWHIDSADWCFGAGAEGYCSPSTYGGMPDRHRDDMLDYILAQAHETNGGVILFHDVHSYTVEQLDHVLTALKNEGFEFVRLDNQDAFPKLNRVDDSEEFAWHGTSCQEANGSTCSYMQGASCHTYSTSEEESEQAGFCTAPCQGYCEDMPGKATTFCTKLSEEDELGRCVSKAKPVNNYCDGMPGTEPVVVSRFVGSSGVPEAEASVCLPSQ